MVTGTRRPRVLWVMLPAVLLLAMSFVTGCMMAAHTTSVTQYHAGNPALAEETAIPLLEKSGDKNYVLYLWDVGMFRFAQGNYLGAIDVWKKAGELSALEPGAVETSLDLFSSDASKNFIGDPVEHSLSWLYVGLGYYMAGEYENATIALRKSIEWDFSTDPERQGDMVITNTLLGECYTRTGEHDQAAVAYRRALNHNPDFVPAYVGLCRELKAMRDRDQADRICGELDSKAPAGYVDNLGKYNSGILVVVMSGPSPTVEKDAFLGAFRKRKEAKTKLDHWVVECVDAGFQTDAGQADDLLTHYKDQGGEGGQALRKGVQAAAGAIMKEVPILGLFAPKTEADLRYWSTLPGKVHAAYLPVPPGTHTVRALAYDKKDRTLDNYRQIWHYIPVREGENTILVLISHANLQSLM